MSNQQIRPSQFITTYGPGSILETRSGPVIVLSMHRVFSDNGLRVGDFEIRDIRLTKDPSLNGASISRIPTNAEVDKVQDHPLYKTEAFPYWSLCVPHRILYMSRHGCQQCASAAKTTDLREKPGRDAIRYVVACSNGHMDDVDWNFVVHNGPACTRQPGYYEFSGAGGALRNIEISCPKCPAKVKFGVVYGRQWNCSQRFPELGGQRAGQDSCSAKAQIIQRGAANLRLPLIVSALTIPALSSPLTDVLQDSRVLNVWSTLDDFGQLTETSFRQRLTKLIPPLLQSDLEFIESQRWEEIENAMSPVMQHATSSSTRPLKEEEFDSLREAAKNGATVFSQQIGVPAHFEVRRSDVRWFDGPTGRLTFRVVPVNRLRMVIVQKGYQRIDPTAGQVVPVSFQAEGRWWYPGVELFGEGIYIDIDDSDMQLSGSRMNSWLSYYQEDQADDSLHPVHVWWHTFSHRLIRALSIDSGYSSAAVRERVYFRPGQPNVGGLLLYTVQPGGDGTLGGLISLVPSFDQVISLAFRGLDACSNDPLCEETKPDGTNGSACYACLFASETSCEFRNSHLDRALLLENPA